LSEKPLWHFACPKLYFFHSRGPEGLVCKDFLGNVGDQTLSVTTVSVNADGERHEYKGAPIECYMHDSLGEVVYTRLDSGWFVVRRLIFTDKVLYREPLLRINWTLGGSTRTIGPYAARWLGRISEAAIGQLGLPHRFLCR